MIWRGDCEIPICLPAGSNYLRPMKSLICLFSFVLTTLNLPAGEEVKYQAGDITAHGYLALPKSASAENKVPGVVVVHEWWGHNAYARKRADMLADLGYAALAIDMYGEGKLAEHPKDAGGFAQEATAKLETMKVRFLGGMKFLQQQEAVNDKEIAAIGYCMGGKICLQMAAIKLPDLKGVASFHGALNVDFPAETKSLDAKVLVCHGNDDTFIPKEVVDAFKAKMKELGADFTFEGYDGAIHSFTNPDATELGKKNGIRVGYHKEADEKSWKALQVFLKKCFAA